MKPGTSSVQIRNTTTWASKLRTSFSINLKVYFYSSFTWWIQNKSRINLHGRILTVFIIYKWLSDAWCRNYLPGKDSSAQSKETFISWSSSVKSPHPQPILLAPLPHYLSIHTSVSVMAKISKFVCTSYFSLTILDKESNYNAWSLWSWN